MCALMSEALEAIHPPPVGSKPVAFKFFVRIYSTEERRLHTTCLETAKKAIESFGLFE